MPKDLKESFEYRTYVWEVEAYERASRRLITFGNFPPYATCGMKRRDEEVVKNFEERYKGFENAEKS